MARNTSTEIEQPENVEPMAISEVGVTVQRDPEKIARLMADRLLSAGSLDEMFDVLKGNTSDQLVGRTLEIVSVEWDAFESDNGLIPLAIVQSVDKSTGGPLEWATTGGMLTRFIRVAEVRGWLPFVARIEEKRTRSGQTALNFVRP